jgi:hypothetical protein
LAWADVRPSCGALLEENFRAPCEDSGVAYQARLGLILSLVVLTCACAHGDKPFDRGAAGTATLPLIRLARTGKCLGSCPTYSVDVDVDGRVRYWGGANVMTVGPATGQLTPEALLQLRSAIGRASHVKMPRERCACGCVADAFDVNLTTWDKGTPTTVTYDDGCE